MANRDINLLSANFKTKVENFISDERIKKLGVFITEAFRSKERQQELYNSGRTKPGPILTWTLNSMHCKGLAIDIACSNGPLYPSDINWWNRVYDIAEEYGIKSLYKTHGVDKPHLECNGGPIPDNNYKNNQSDMENLKQEFEDNNFKALRLLISNMRKATDNPEFREELAKFGKYMDSIQK